VNTHPYILNDVLPFASEKSVKELQSAFNQLTYTHFPITKDGVFEGCISNTDVHCFESDKKIEDYLYAIEPFFVRLDTNWLDILEAFGQNDTNVMPVLDEKNNYQGYYELGDIIGIFNNTPFLNEAGGIIVVEKGVRDYSFSEICQIIESNDAKILGVFISHLDGDNMQATIKIGHQGMNEIVQTFRRYDYNIISSHDEDLLLENLKERSNYLDRYLNI
jgi:hypothetical protein